MATIELVGEERWSTLSVFNSNAFPVGLEPNVKACSTRAAIHLVHFNMLEDAIEKNCEDFQKELKINITDQTIASLKNKHSDSMIVYYDGIDFLAAFHDYLHSLKSFLDVYSILICKTIQPTLMQKILFDTRTIGGEKISGGKVLNWLKHSAPQSFTNSLKLQEVFEKHSKDWITEAIKYRDTLSHFRDIEGMEVMRVYLNPPSYNCSKIFLPLMPGGQLVVDYCSELLSKLRKFVEESMILLPNIEMGNITFTNFLIVGHRNG